MQIEVRLDARLSGLVGKPRVKVDLADGATVADLLRRLGETYPGLRPGLTAALPLVHGNHATAEQKLSADEEVALLMPAAGG